MKVLVHLRPGEGYFYLQLLKMAFPDAEALLFQMKKIKQIFGLEIIYIKKEIN